MVKSVIFFFFWKSPSDSSVAMADPIRYTVHKNRPVAPEDEICITGISGRFPDSNNMDELKENLFAKRDLISGDDRRWKLGTFPNFNFAKLKSQKFNLISFLSYFYIYVLVILFSIFQKSLRTHCTNKFWIWCNFSMVQF